MAIALDRRHRRVVVAEFIALPVESGRLCVKVFPALFLMPRWQFCRRFGKALGGVRIAQSRQRDIALAGLHLRQVERVPILRFLRSLLQLAGFAERYSFQLLGPAKQSIRLCERPLVQRVFRLPSQFGDVRVVRLQRRQLIPRGGKLGRNFTQPQRGFFFRDVLLAQDFENRVTACEVNPNFAANSATFTSASRRFSSEAFLPAIVSRSNFRVSGFSWLIVVVIVLFETLPPTETLPSRA